MLTLVFTVAHIAIVLIFVLVIRIRVRIGVRSAGPRSRSGIRNAPATAL